MQVLAETMENSERLGQQGRPGIGPGTSRLPVLRAEPLGYWCYKAIEVGWPSKCHEFVSAPF